MVIWNQGRGFGSVAVDMRTIGESEDLLLFSYFKVSIEVRECLQRPVQHGI